MKNTKPSTQKNITVSSGLRSDWRALVLALALALALEVLGGTLLPKREDFLYQILWLCDMALIALCYLTNFLLKRRIDFLYGKRKLPEINETMQQRQRDVEANFQQAARRLRRSFWFARLWYTLMLLLVGLAALLMIPASVPIYVFLLGVYILWGLLCIWFHKSEDERPSLEMPEESYPVIYDLVHQAAKTAGCTMPVRVYAGGTSVSIFRMPKEIGILLDAVTCALCTKQELYNMLLHEFAHEFNEDTVQTMRMSRELQRWSNLPEGVLSGIGGYLLSGPAVLINLEYMLYNLFATKRKEELADARAARWGDAQMLVNSLAKLSVWWIFEHNMPVPELLLYSEYAGEAPPEDLPAKALAAYRRMLPDRRDEWRHRLDVELPPRVSSHPIFRERRKAFGVADYSFEGAETDPAYLSEIDAMLDLTGKAIAGQMAKDYEQKRNYYYLERKALIDQAKTVTDWSACKMDERIEMARALSVLEPALEETVIQSIRQEDPRNAYGCMLLGAKRFRENDPACIELLYQAAKENNNFVEEAYDMIGDFALRNGDQALLDQYRSEAAEVIQEARNTSVSLALHWSGRNHLSENDLPSERFEANRTAILERTEGKLSRLYSVKKPVADGFCYYYFLEFAKELDRDERARLYRQVFLYLDYCEEQYYLDDLTDQPKQRDRLLKMVPDCELSCQKPK